MRWHKQVNKNKNVAAPNTHCQRKHQQPQQQQQRQRRRWHKSFIIEIVLCARNVFAWWNYLLLHWNKIIMMQRRSRKNDEQERAVEAATAKQELFHKIFTACVATVNYVNKWSETFRLSVIWNSTCFWQKEPNRIHSSTASVWYKQNLNSRPSLSVSGPVNGGCLPTNFANINRIKGIWLSNFPCFGVCVCLCVCSSLFLQLLLSVHRYSFFFL